MISGSDIFYISENALDNWNYVCYNVVIKYQRKEDNMEEFRIAAYTRISVDTELDKENTSIENQKAIIDQYCKLHFPTSTVDYYEDRDKSGYTFDQRPDYMRLRPKLMNKQYDILILKDLSRFSRRTGKGLAEFEDIIETGIRIIAISDDVDYPLKDDFMKIKLYFFVNEMPVTDASKKVSAVIANRQSKGEWVCTVPYGYVMKNAKKGIFEVDEVAAPVVREIFSLYNKGDGYKKIANYLTDKHIPTPRMRLKEIMEQKGDECKLKVKEEWSIITIQKILTNDFYIGTLRQHKWHREKINGSDIRTDDSEHIVFEGHHTAIVEYSDFAFAQQTMAQRTTSSYRGVKKYENMYTGVLFCGDCGSPMFSRSRPNLKPAYICGKYQKRGTSGCTSHHILTDTLDKQLKKYVKMVSDNSERVLSELQKSLLDNGCSHNNSVSAIEELQRLMESTKEELKTLLKQKTRDIIKGDQERSIIEETYDELISETENRIKGIENQMSLVADTANTVIKIQRTAKTVLEVFDDILNKEHLDKRDISLIVDRIIVYEDHIDIKLKPDIDALLNLDSSESGSVANFNSGTEGIESASVAEMVCRAVQSVPKRKDKTFSVCVINDGSPSRILIVLLISLGMTTLPRSSILLTIPVAFIYKFLS